MAIDQTLTARSPYNDVSTETIEGHIQGAPLNTSLANLEIAVEQHRHGTNSCIGFDSMKADFRPPDTGDSTNRWRWVCGAKTGSITNGTGSAVVTFATDADQGDPSFTTVPRAVAVVTTVGGGISGVVVKNVNPISTTAATFVLAELNGMTNSGAVNIHWMAYGKVA